MSTAGRAYVWVAIAEAITWALLLIGMFFKYVTKSTDVLVSVFGALHGGVFLIYCVVTAVVAFTLRWPFWAVATAFIAAVPPLMTIPAERLFRRRGLLGSVRASD